MRRLAKYTSNGVMLLALVIGLAFILIRLLGFAPMVVLTGSMTPTYMPGDIVYLQPYDETTLLKISDVVTFQKEPEIPEFITHRVKTISWNQYGEIGSVQTQGDANNIADKPIGPNQIAGVVKFSIPKLGYVSNYVINNPIQSIGMGIALALSLYLLSSYGVSSFSKKH